MMKHFFSRRNYVVQPRFQLSLAAKAMVFLVLYAGVVAFLILYPVRELIELLPADGLTPKVKHQILTLPHYVWPLILILAFIIAIQVILLSHRLSGPSFRLRHAMREMATGQYQPLLTLRKNDYLKEVAESLAFLGTILDRRRQTLLGELGKLRTRLEQHQQHMRGGESPTALQGDLDWMLHQLSVLERLADGADVPGEPESTASDLSPAPVTAKELSIP